MRRVASANRSRPSCDRRYSLSLPMRRPSSQPSLARRAAAVRTSRSLSPKGAARAMRLPRARAPPRGMMGSPNRATLSEPRQGAARHDGVAEEGRDERAAAERLLAAKASDEFSGGGGHVIGHFASWWLVGL